MLTSSSAPISLPWSQKQGRETRKRLLDPLKKFLSIAYILRHSAFRKWRNRHAKELPISDRPLCQILYSKSKQLTHKSFNYITSFQKSDKREEEDESLARPSIPICRNLTRPIVGTRRNLISPFPTRNASNSIKHHTETTFIHFQQNWKGKRKKNNKPTTKKKNRTPQQGIAYAIISMQKESRIKTWIRVNRLENGNGYCTDVKENRSSVSPAAHHQQSSSLLHGWSQSQESKIALRNGTVLPSTTNGKPISTSTRLFSHQNRFSLALFLSLSALGLSPIFEFFFSSPNIYTATALSIFRGYFYKPSFSFSFSFHSHCNSLNWSRGRIHKQNPSL